MMGSVRRPISAVVAALVLSAMPAVASAWRGGGHEGVFCAIKCGFAIKAV